MKKILVLIASLFCISPLFLFADNISRNGYGSNPSSILDSVVKKANDEYQIQKSQLDGITSTTSGEMGDMRFRITNTLEYLKNHIHPYIQWFVYIALSLATILLIYNGFLMVTNVTHGDGDLAKVKWRIINIAIGIIVLTGFYYLIDIITAVINFIFT